MGVATATPSISATQLNAIDNTQKTQIIRGTIAISAAADTYAAGGIVCSFASLAEQIKADSPPTEVDVWSQTGTATPNTTLYLYSFQPGTTLALGKLQIWEQSGVDDTPLDEYDDTGALTNPFADVIHFRAYFIRGI